MKTEILPGGIKLLQSDGHLKLGADAVLLAAFCPPAERICELGCGVGNVLLALAGRQPEATLVGVEINPDAAALCRESVALNALGDRVEIVTGDLREFPPASAPPAFDLVVMNPPYLRAGTVRESPDPARNLERVDRTAAPCDVASAAARLLCVGGALCLVLRYDRLGDYLAALAEAALAVRELRPVAHTAGREPSLVLVRAEKGGEAGEAGEAGVEPAPTLYLANADGSPSEEYARVLAGERL